MNNFQKLCKELELHREQMFFTIGRTISAAANLVDDELFKSLKAICSIYDDKYLLFLHNKQAGVESADFWDWIEEKYLQNYENEGFSFSWIKSIDQLKSCVSPLFDDDAYQDFLQLTNYTGQEELSLCEQLFFLSGAFRFYQNLGTTEPPNIDINFDMTMILRIDRETACIRENISSIIATRKNAVGTAKGRTNYAANKQLDSPDPFKDKNKQYRDVYIQTAKELNNRKKPISFNKFVESVAPKANLSKTGLYQHLRAIGVHKANFKEWFEKLLT